MIVIKSTISILLTIVLCYSDAMGQNNYTGKSLPVHLLEKSSVVFKGTFYSGRGPGQTYGEGKRRWRLIKGFKVDQDLIGNIRINEIEINPNILNDSLRNENVEKNLVIENQYYVLLYPDIEKLKYIENNKIPFNYYNHIISEEEVIAIIKID